MTNVEVGVAPVTFTLPKSDPSAALGVASPSRMFSVCAALVTLISGAVTPEPETANVYGFSSASLVAKETVSDASPTTVGSKVTWNVVEAPAATGLVGWLVIEKTVPVVKVTVPTVRSVVPSLRIVKVPTAVPPVTSAAPTNVPSVGPGVASPLTISVPIPSAVASGAAAATATVKLLEARLSAPPLFWAPAALY